LTRWTDSLILVASTIKEFDMADISHTPFARHLRGTATSYVQHLRRGAVAHEGVGAAFWFRPRTAVLSEVPVDDRELPLLVHARTADFQDVLVQGTVTFRFAAPAQAASHIDFGIDPRTGRWRGMPLEQVAGVVTETATSHAVDLIAGLDLARALSEGLGPVREAITAGLREDARLAETGILVLSVRMAAIRPTPEMDKALATPAREAIQQEADRATFERRAIAVEREAAIGENELANQIELARRQEQLVVQKGANARRAAQESAETGRISTEAEAARTERLAQAAAEAERLTGAASAQSERARLAAYTEVSEGVLMALALKEAAAHLPAIEQLVLTPDLVSTLLARLTAGSAGATGSPTKA
jgi:regulator of protease activity HflC (stomatin/prohibitin superfamily)